MSQKSSPTYRYRVRRYADRCEVEGYYQSLGWAPLMTCFTEAEAMELAERMVAGCQPEDGHTVDPHIAIVAADGSPWVPGSNSGRGVGSC